MGTGKGLTIAVLGAGHWGPNLIRNFHDASSSKVAWICETDPERRRAMGAAYHDIKITHDPMRILDDPAVDAVVIATPSATHYRLAEAALKAGKHVLVEKPMCTDLQDARRLQTLAVRMRRKLMVGHVFLFHPAIQVAKQMLQQNALGRLLYLYSIRTNLGPIRNDVNALWDLGAHDISIFQYWLGHQPSRVRGVGSSFINPPVEDIVFATLHFPESVLANLHVSWLDPKKVRQIVIVGSQKMLVFDDRDTQHPLKLFDKNVGENLSRNRVNDTIQLFRKSIVEGAVQYPEVPEAEPLALQCQAFRDWILHEKVPDSDGVFGVKVVETLTRISHAMKANDESHLTPYFENTSDDLLPLTPQA